VIPGPKGAPLLYAGIRAGVPTAVLAFEPRRSDLPLQVAFPILIANLTGELMGGSAAPADAVKPGDPVALPVPAGATGLRVERPDGSVVDLAPGPAGGTSVTFSQTDLLGVYVATSIRPTSAGASGSPAATPSPTPAASATPRPSGAVGSGAGRVDPNAPVRFAVDLFDVAESTITPGSVAALEKLGRSAAVPVASPAPGASAAPDAAAASRPPARDELWFPIVLIVLVALCVEWALYHRDVVTRAWRGLSRRVRPPVRGSA
jgi:hypothetical protein